VDVLLIPIHIIGVTSFDIDYTPLNLSVSSACPYCELKMDIRLLTLYEHESRILLL
jgi:hypothetical protein